MNDENKDILINLLNQHKELGISEQIDFDKFYLYSIITHSTAIEGSTVTEVEAQLLFDEGITSSKRTMMEQMMNLDLKAAYDYAIKWILHCKHLKYDIDTFISSIAEEMDSTSSLELVDKHYFAREMVDKWSIKPNLADKLGDILVFMADKEEIKTEMIVSEFGFTETTAKRYLRQLTEFGYLEAHGGNRNRTYKKADIRQSHSAIK